MVNSKRMKTDQLIGLRNNNGKGQLEYDECEKLTQTNKNKAIKMEKSFKKRTQYAQV